MERRFGARIEWLPFDLHPEYPAEGIPRGDLHARYGEERMGQTKGMVEECGYTYNPPKDVVPNSRKALELTELARDLGIHEPVHTRLMDAYWAEARNIGDEDAPVARGRAGLDRSSRRGARTPLLPGSHRARGRAIGINVPSFCSTTGCSSSVAPKEVFRRAFAQLAQAGAT
jgi:hypothetical protein